MAFPVVMPAGVDPVTGHIIPVKAPAATINLSTGKYWDPEAIVKPLDSQALQINARMQAANHAKAVTAYQNRAQIPTIKEPVFGRPSYTQGGAIVRFYTRDNKPWVYCQPNPTDRTTIIDRPATENDISRWHFEYRQYESATE